MSTRLRGDFLNGIVTNITAGNPGILTLSSGFNISIPSGYYLPIVLNPPPYAQVSGTNYISEIVWTSGTYVPGTTSYTVLRAQEGTNSIGAQANIPCAVGPTAQDFGITNWMSNNDISTPTASGEFLQSTNSGVSQPTWVFGYLVPSGGSTGQVVTVGPSGAPILTSTLSGITILTTISGYQVTGYLSNSVISGSQVYGNLNNATISGQLIIGNIAAGQINGYLSNATISGSQVTGFIAASQINGYLANTTISGSQIVGNISAVSGYLPNATISGTNVYGYLPNSTISGSQIVGTITGLQITGTISGVNIINTTLSGNTYINGNFTSPTTSGGVFTVPTITAPLETVQLYNYGLSGTQTLYLNQGSINYFTASSSGNFIINATINGSSIASTLITGQSISFVVMNTNGTTPYVISGFQIDGGNVALHWQGGTVPTIGNASATDYYSFSIIKTNNSPTYWVTVGLTKAV